MKNFRKRYLQHFFRNDKNYYNRDRCCAWLCKCHSLLHVKVKCINGRLRFDQSATASSSKTCPPQHNFIKRACSLRKSRQNTCVLELKSQNSNSVVEVHNLPRVTWLTSRLISKLDFAADFWPIFTIDRGVIQCCALFSEKNKQTNKPKTKKKPIKGSK